MAKEIIDKLDVMIGLELACDGLKDYFTLKKVGRNDNEIRQEFFIDRNDPRSLAQMMGDFTHCFLYDNHIKKWGMINDMKALDDNKKYALRVLGKKIKSKNGNSLDEEKAFSYIGSNLRYLLKNLKKGDESEKIAAYVKAEKFFTSLLNIASKELKKMGFS